MLWYNIPIYVKKHGMKATSKQLHKCIYTSQWLGVEKRTPHFNLVGKQHLSSAAIMRNTALKLK
jgi:hypothetical protein